MAELAESTGNILAVSNQQATERDSIVMVDRRALKIDLLRHDKLATGVQSFLTPDDANKFQCIINSAYVQTMFEKVFCLDNKTLWSFLGYKDVKNISRLFRGCYHSVDEYIERIVVQRLRVKISPDVLAKLDAIETAKATALAVRFRDSTLPFGRVSATIRSELMLSTCVEELTHDKLPGCEIMEGHPRTLHGMTSKPYLIVKRGIHDVHIWNVRDCRSLGKFDLPPSPMMFDRVTLIDHRLIGYFRLAGECIVRIYSEDDTAAGVSPRLWAMDCEIRTGYKAFDTVHGTYPGADGNLSNGLLYVGAERINGNGDVSTQVFIGTVDIDGGTLSAPIDVVRTPPFFETWAVEHWLTASILNKKWLVTNSSRYGILVRNMETGNTRRISDRDAVCEVKADRDSGILYARMSPANANFHKILWFKMTENGEHGKFVQGEGSVTIFDRAPVGSGDYDAQQLLDVDYQPGKFHRGTIVFSGYNYLHFIDGNTGQIIHKSPACEWRQESMVLLPGTGLYAAMTKEEDALPKLFVSPKSFLDTDATTRNLLRAIGDESSTKVWGGYSGRKPCFGLQS